MPPCSTARYAEAEAHYRAAIDGGPAGPDVEHKLERARPTPRSGWPTATSKSQCSPSRWSAVAADGAYVEPPSLPSPPLPPPLPDGPVHKATVLAGRALGLVGTGVFHGLTKLASAARHQRRDVDELVHHRRPASRGLSKWVQILKLAHMRETLFENNLVRPYPDGAKTGYANAAAPSRRRAPAAGARPTAAGTTSARTPTAGIDPMVGAAYTRFFRNVGDDQGLAGVQPRGTRRPTR